MAQPLPVLTRADELAHLHRSCVLVPTMGALHAGHGDLVRRAADLARKRSLAGGCVVSVFVNPTQFDDPTDFQRYPRTLDADLELCKIYGASAVFAPTVDAVYPPGEAAPTVAVPPVGDGPGLEDGHRAGHFAGVCQVVHRLFELVRPAAAIFGEKDYQQLRVVSAMVRDLGLSVEIVPGPTVRDHDGLALSSRNRFLSPEDRRRALALSRALCESWAQPTPEAGEASMREILAANGITPDYAVIRDAQTLLPVPTGTKPTAWRGLIAARVGPVRLIDNTEWRPDGD